MGFLRGFCGFCVSRVGFLRGFLRGFFAWLFLSEFFCVGFLHGGSFEFRQESGQARS